MGNYFEPSSIDIKTALLDHLGLIVREGRPWKPKAFTVYEANYHAHVDSYVSKILRCEKLHR